MKPIFSLCFLFLVFSCAPSKEKICGKIDDSIRHAMEKAASGANKKLSINELHTIDFKMVGAGLLDTLSKENYRQKIADFSKRYAASGNGAKALVDSVDYYTKLDSLTTLQITNRWQDPQVYYYSKTYVNATIGSQTIHDTLRYALDRTFKLIPM